MTPSHVAFLTWLPHDRVAAMYGYQPRWIIDRVKQGEFGTGSDHVIQEGQTYLISTLGLATFNGARRVFDEQGVIRARTAGEARRRFLRGSGQAAADRPNARTEEVPHGR
jgi:hypothetical protein